MIISRTPFRISFFGGGTDYPAWYEDNGGAVIATTINKYNYVICRHLPPFFDHKYRIRYRQTEEVLTIDEIKHPSVRECLKYCELDRGLEIQHNSDLPAMSGLASSSSFTVGLLNALAALQGRMLTKRQLALDAIHVEQNCIKENVGSQDQTITAFGGLNLIRFGGERKIDVTPITIGLQKIELLQRNLMLFFTGFTRFASNVAGEQIRAIPKRTDEMKSMMGLLEEALAVLNGREESMDDFGKLLHEGWKIKRNLSTSISNSLIDEIYCRGIDAGAIGGKLLGAGGGGFMLFYARPENREKVKAALNQLLYVPVTFENLGSQIVYYAPNTDF